MADIIFKADDYIVDVGIVGVLVKDGKILVQRDRNGNEYALSDGHIKLGETIADGLIREYKEETGADMITVVRFMYYSVGVSVFGSIAEATSEATAASTLAVFKANRLSSIKSKISFPKEALCNKSFVIS